MTKNFLVLRYIFLVCTISLPNRTNAGDGFMNDFFNRFPNLPFANMKSLKHIQNHGSVTARDSLLADEPGPFKRQIQRSDRLMFKSKVLSAPKSDVQAQGKHPYILTSTRYTSEYKYTTPNPRSIRKRIFIAKPTYIPLHLPSLKPYTSNLLQ